MVTKKKKKTGAIISARTFVFTNEIFQFSFSRNYANALGQEIVGDLAPFPLRQEVGAAANAATWASRRTNSASALGFGQRDLDIGGMSAPHDKKYFPILPWLRMRCARLRLSPTR